MVTPLFCTVLVQESRGVVQCAHGMLSRGLREHSPEVILPGSTTARFANSSLRNLM